MGIEGNSIDTVVHGKVVSNVPGSQAGTPQCRRVSKFHQGEAGEGVLSLQLSALGQRQEKAWRKTQKRSIAGSSVEMLETTFQAQRHHDAVGPGTSSPRNHTPQLQSMHQYPQLLGARI